MPLKRRTIALIAHDGKKTELISFVKDNLEFFKSFHLVATSTTGKYVQQTEPDIYSLLRICDVHDVPLATNPSSAQMIVEGLHKRRMK